MITEKTYIALKVLENTSPIAPMSAKQFAFLLWGDNEQFKYLFTSVSYGDNGAVSGKKAWLCAGSLLGKLAKRKLVRWTPERKGYNHNGYFLTNEGREELTRYESQKNKAMNSVIENNKRTKTRMLGLYVLERLDGNADFLKLMCLLYLAERKHLIEYGTPMIPYQFVALGYFPCIEGINDMFFWGLGDDKVDIYGTPSLEYVKKTLNMDWLSQSDTECIDEVINECKDDSDETLTEKCWIKAGPETFEKNGMMAVIPKTLIAEEGGASPDLVEYIKEQVLIDDFLDK